MSSGRRMAMLRVSARVAALVAAALVAPLVFAEAPQNDAGLGLDAGNSLSTATPLPSLGRYDGELRSKDNDWFTLHRAATPVCVTHDAGGSPEAYYTLRTRSGTTEHAVKALLPTTGELRLALAGSAVTQTWAGFERVPNPAKNDPTRPGTYGFALGERGVADATEGTTMNVNDAGSMLSGAFPLEGACTAGRLQPLGGAGDVVDLWKFSGVRGQQIVYTLGATGPVTLQLTTAAGKSVGPAISPDGLANVTLPADGEYTMQASATGGSDVLSYIMGLTGPDPPPGSPCRPTCRAE